MDPYKRLFKEAERLEAGPSLWSRIAAAVTSPARPSASLPGSIRPGRPAGSASPASADAGGASPAHANGQAWPWRLAASLAVGLGVVAALAVLFREPPRTASPEGAGSAADRQLATASPEEAGQGLLEWHADLGVPAEERVEDVSAENWMDDTLLLNPLLEE